MDQEQQEQVDGVAVDDVARVFRKSNRRPDSIVVRTAKRKTAILLARKTASALGRSWLYVVFERHPRRQFWVRVYHVSREPDPVILGEDGAPLAWPRVMFVRRFSSSSTERPS